MDWLNIVWTFINKIVDFWKWFRCRKQIKVIENLTDYEKNILNGLYKTPIPLELYQAYNKSTGRSITLGELHLSHKEELIDKLEKKKLILSRKNGYILTNGAEDAIFKGALQIKR